MKPILRLILVMTGVMLFASKFCSAQNWPVETIKVNSWINATGDFDNDGDPDLVVINSDTIFWFENLQPGWKQHVIDPGFPNSDVASWVDAFDMDLDGDPDILQFIVTNPGTIVWNENRNNGMQWQKHTISTNVNEPSNMPRSYGDIDNDNDIDIVVPGFGDGKILWFENVSDNTLWKKHEIAVLGSYSVWTTLADIDGDSDLDIVAARYYAGSIVWYENQLPDSSWSMNRIAALPGTALGECVDLDNDGDLDLVTHSNATGAEVLSWFENPSWTPHAITSGLKYLWPGPCGDIDNDGDLDVTYASINSMQWSENLGEAKQWKNHIIQTVPGYNPTPVALADINSDNFLDVVGYTINYTNGNGDARWYANPMSTTAVANSRDHILPVKITLSQNHPNPFNPLTSIYLSLPSSEFVTLDVYDLNGREIATLVNGPMTAGNHAINFDGSQLASGIYLYRLRAGEYIETKKMTLVK